MLGTGSITEEMFVDLLKRKWHAHLSNDEIMSTYRIFDIEGVNGFTAKELKEVLG